MCARSHICIEPPSAGGAVRAPQRHDAAWTVRHHGDARHTLKARRKTLPVSDHQAAANSTPSDTRCVRSRTQRARLSPHRIGRRQSGIRRSRTIGGISHGIAAPVPVPYRCDLRIAALHEWWTATSQGTAQSGRARKRKRKRPAESAQQGCCRTRSLSRCEGRPCERLRLNIDH